eukprot:scaffold9430_cov128-Isochrysis_galbana.AAC.4
MPDILTGAYLGARARAGGHFSFSFKVGPPHFKNPGSLAGLRAARARGAGGGRGAKTSRHTGTGHAALTTPLPRQPPLLPAGRRPQPASRRRHVHLRPCPPATAQPPAAAVATAPPRPHPAAASAASRAHAH